MNNRRQDGESFIPIILILAGVFQLRYAIIHGFALTYLLVVACVAAILFKSK
jgi:hypothetical protein